MSTEERVLLVLLLAVPATIVSSRLGAPAVLQFFLSVLAVIPLAGFIGSATEALADRIGARAGGLLNATFGNAPDLLVGVFGVQKGLIPLVKATLVGALISNSALIMGLCCLLAGLKYGKARFRRAEAGHHSVLMFLTLAAVLFPSIGSIAACGGDRCAGGGLDALVFRVSIAIAVALLLGYAAYVLFGVLGLERMRPRRPARATRAPAPPRKKAAARWPLWVSVAVLVASAVLLIPVTDILTGNVVAVTTVLGWSEVFVGIIIVANAGNVAEGYAAIRLAIQRPSGTGDTQEDSGLDLALGIASASSIQIAALIAPLVVIYSVFGHHMTLVFSSVEIAILGLLTLLFTHIAHDGETNWLEGFQLLVLYAMAAVVFYEFPARVFG